MWVSFKDFGKHVSEMGFCFSARVLRAIIKERETNGAEYFCKKIGGRYYFCPSRFKQWVEKL